MKKYISFILSIVLLFCLAVINASANTDSYKKSFIECNPINFIGLAFDDIIEIYGSDYTTVNETGHKDFEFIVYSDKEIPYRFGYKKGTNLITAIYIDNNKADKPIALFDDINNLTTGKNLDSVSSNYDYSKKAGNLMQAIPYTRTFKLSIGKTVIFEWYSFGTGLEAERVFIMQTDVEPTTAPNTEKPTKEESITQESNTIVPSSLSDSTSKVLTSDNATKDSITNDNSTIQTGIVPIVVIISLILFALSSGAFVWYKRKTK